MAEMRHDASATHSLATLSCARHAPDLREQDIDTIYGGRFTDSTQDLGNSRHYVRRSATGAGDRRSHEQLFATAERLVDVLQLSLANVAASRPGLDAAFVRGRFAHSLPIAMQTSDESP